jgi:cytochrome c-type biogenesis protein
MAGDKITIAAAFLEGILSFFSPCVFPLIPAYFTFITGFSVDELSQAKKQPGKNQSVKMKVIFSTVLFVAGFSFVFVMMGAAASSLGGLIFRYGNIIRISGGILIFAFGVHLTGLITIPGLSFDKRVHLKKKPAHIFGTFIVGMAFGAGWSPCVGPMLGSILAIAATKQHVGEGMFLLGFYSLGFAVPFLIISVFVNYMIGFIKKMVKFTRYVNITSGVILIVIGVLLIGNWVNYFAIG